MVAGGLEGVFQASEDGLAVVVDHGGFAVHKSVGPDDAGSEAMADALMTQTNAEQRDLASEVFNHLVGYASLQGRAGAGRDNHAGWGEFLGLGDGDFVVAEDLYIKGGIQLADPLDQVVSEGIVVVDDQDHG